LSAEWKVSETGREAKYYSLTRLGIKQLAVEGENWQRLSEAVRLVMNTAR
jgi:DNA-binding PadR family transcriptional regulator